MNWQTGFFKSFDGIPIHFRHTVHKQSCETTIIHLHRGHEHSERIIPFAESLALSNTRHFAFDLRGHGLSGGPKAWAKNFQVWVKDLNEFVKYLKSEHKVKSESIIIVANSVGAVTAASWILRYNPQIAGCVFGAPAFSIKLYVPLAHFALKCLMKFTEKGFVTSYVKSSMLTNSQSEAQAYDSDPMISKKIGVNVLVTLLDEAKWILSRAQDFETPVLILSASKDFVVKSKPQKLFFERVSSPIKRFVSLPKSKHAVFHEENKSEIAQLCRNFISEITYTQSRSKALAVIPSARSHTVDEYFKFAKPPGILKRMKYLFSRVLMNSIGRWSRGMNLGLESGFNSGDSLDYVYANTIEGKNPIGKLIDRFYLNSLGWKEVRKRKHQLTEDILQALNEIRNRGDQPIVLDIACGQARYLVDALKEFKDPVTIHLNDRSENCVEIAERRLKESLDLSESRITRSHFDIFRPEEIGQINISPNLIIASGVIELYPENAHVQNCFQILFEKAAPDAQFIYTGQPWHPQLELIARTLNNGDGRRWIMRRRIQSELDEIVEYSGFNKIETHPNDSGIFTVSKAVKSSHMEDQHGH